MNLKEELTKFRIWQKENKSTIYLYTPDFMVDTYLIDTKKALNIDDVIVPNGALVCKNCIHFEVCNKQHKTVETCGYYKE